MKRIPSSQPNYTVRREYDGRARSRLALLLGCGLMLACGFLFAARQHFAAVHYGYQSEELRREQTRLIEEQRRLMLEREQIYTPSSLETAARQIGLQPVRPAQIEVAKGAGGAPALVSPAISLSR